MIIEHVHKVVHIKEGKHGMPYGYYLNRVFNNFKVVCERGTPDTVKYMFTLTILIENKYVEEKVGTKSQVSELMDVWEKLIMEVDELRLALVDKYTDISHFMLKIQQLSSEGPGAS